MSNHVAPTVGRVVWYRGKDNLIRAAIVAAVHSQFCINLFAFGATADDSDCGYKTEVTHDDIEHEPSCCPSWSWMPYQKNKANAGQFVSGSVGFGESSEQAIEQEIQAKGLNAPRLTPEHIDAKILGADYKRFNGTTVTICCLYLENGFTLTGESACASPENFDAEIGKKIAYQNAREKVWQLEGYLLRQRLHDEEFGKVTTVADDLSPHNTINS